ncbi:MAG: hypothetical protein MZU97_07770 [Bacillus subtilis]|nr:hypothetical protein [Bacillus subtilis]
MPDDPDIRLMDTEAEEVYSPDRKRTGTDKKKVGIFAAIGVVVLAVIGGIYMMLGGGGVSKDEVRLMQTKIGSLEQKITALEKQQGAPAGKAPRRGRRGGPDGEGRHARTARRGPGEKARRRGRGKAEGRPEGKSRGTLGQEDPHGPEGRDDLRDQQEIRDEAGRSAQAQQSRRGGHGEARPETRGLQVDACHP